MPPELELENSHRTAAYRKDAALERLMAEVNRLLAAAMRDGRPETSAALRRPVFVIGTQRSGTTLLMQLFAQCFRCTYPDNIVARFWEAPFVGVMVSRSLRAQFGNTPRQSFNSDYGVTPDPFGPHEFGYFWTRWFGFEPAHELSEEQLARVDVAGLRQALALMQHYGDGPLVFKTVPLSLNASFLADCFPDARFVHIRRDPLFVAQSTYIGRIKQYGDPARWWSLKPAAWTELSRLPPLEQVAAQAIWSQRLIAAELRRIDPARWIEIEYRDVCASPPAECARLEAFLTDVAPTGVLPPPQLCHQIRPQLPNEQFAELESAVERFREAGAFYRLKSC